MHKRIANSIQSIMLYRCILLLAVCILIVGVNLNHNYLYGKFTYEETLQVVHTPQVTPAVLKLVQATPATTKRVKVEPAVSKRVQAKPATAERLCVFFCVPVKSTASMRSLLDTELINTLFPSLAQSIAINELGAYKIKHKIIAEALCRII